MQRHTRTRARAHTHTGRCRSRAAHAAPLASVRQAAPVQPVFCGLSCASAPAHYPYRPPASPPPPPAATRTPRAPCRYISVYICTVHICIGVEPGGGGMPFADGLRTALLVSWRAALSCKHARMPPMPRCPQGKGLPPFRTTAPVQGCRSTVLSSHDRESYGPALASWATDPTDPTTPGPKGLSLVLHATGCGGELHAQSHIVTLGEQASELPLRLSWL